ncbi:MAG: hypothetical protein HXY49_05870 [Ignavibacteriaceae bacterium]|nr:hypothetical protein [Ignavibacteriaceae bacterium]
MKILKIVRNSLFITFFAVTALILSSCGGLSEAQIAELNNLRNEVKSLEDEVQALKEEKSRLEKEIQEKNLKLAQCEKEKQQTQANLQKLPK